jgi:L-ribulose-5-phosphate 3-epimerase
MLLFGAKHLIRRTNVRRREFLGAMGASVLGRGMLAATNVKARAGTQASSATSAPNDMQGSLPPMAVGLMIQPANGAEAAIARVKELGLSNCFLSLDGYIGHFTPLLAQQLNGLLQKYSVVATSVEVVGPGRLVWDFLDGPSTIGLVPRESRAARIDALKQTSDFAKMMGIPRVQTHCGFIPENPRDPLYDEAVHAIREVAQYCASNGQDFLMETGQETPTTLIRAFSDVNQPNLGIGFDTANLILYGKANPADAVDIIGPHVKSVHAKDGKFPTDPMQLGEEVLIGTGRVDFTQVFSKLHNFGYTGAITIEREISGPQQIEDVKKEKIYLENIIVKIRDQKT